MRGCCTNVLGGSAGLLGGTAREVGKKQVLEKRAPPGALCRPRDWCVYVHMTYQYQTRCMAPAVRYPPPRADGSTERKTTTSRATGQEPQAVGVERWKGSEARQAGTVDGVCGSALTAVQDQAWPRCSSLWAAAAMDQACRCSCTQGNSDGWMAGARLPHGATGRAQLGRAAACRAQRAPADGSPMQRSLWQPVGYVLTTKRSGASYLLLQDR